MKAAIDTCSYLDFSRGNMVLAMRLEGCDELYVPFIVAAELRCGFCLAKTPEREASLFSAFLTRPGVAVLYADSDTPRHYADLWLQLRRAGQPIPQNDLWIAALAVQHGLVLFTQDRHFDVVAQLQRA